MALYCDLRMLSLELYKIVVNNVTFVGFREAITPLDLPLCDSQDSWKGEWNSTA